LVEMTNRILSAGISLPQVKRSSRSLAFRAANEPLIYPFGKDSRK